MAVVIQVLRQGSVFAQTWPALVSLWTLDEIAGASFADSGPAGVPMDIGGSWQNLATDSMIDGVGGTSAYAGGSGYATIAANHPSHDLAELTISFYYQRRSAAAKHIILAAGDGGQPGDFSIEVLANGRLRGWHTGADGVLRFFGSSDGIVGTELQVGTARRIDVTFGSLGARIYLDGDPLPHAAILANTNGWNNARVKFLGVFTNGVSSPADGAFDGVRIWDRQLTAIQIASLEPARSISLLGEYVTTPEAHGWSAGNPDAQNTAAFQAAIDDASANAASSGTGRGVVELTQGKLYTVRVSSNGSSSSNPVNALTAMSNVEIRTAGKPTRASGNQAIVKWHSFAGFGNASIKHRNLLWISNVSNFHCGYLQLHGNKNTLPSRFTVDYSSGTNGGMSCISMRNTISAIVLKELNVQHAITDGLLSSCNGTTNVLIEDCNFTRSRRQGMSMGRNNVSGSSHDQLVFRRCRFEDTGDFPGDIEGLQPGYGVDIEPDQTSTHVYGVTFDDCDFTDNLGSLYINEEQVTFFLFGHGLGVDCKATLANFKVINCRGTGNTTRGITLGLREAPTWNDLLIENFVSTGNGDNGMNVSASGSGIGGRITNLTMVNCDLSAVVWEDGGFPAPWNAGWSVTIWRGDFNPTVTSNGVATVTVNPGFPP